MENVDDGVVDLARRRRGVAGNLDLGFRQTFWRTRPKVYRKLVSSRLPCRSVLPYHYVVSALSDGIGLLSKLGGMLFRQTFRRVRQKVCRKAEQRFKLQIIASL